MKINPLYVYGRFWVGAAIGAAAALGSSIIGAASNARKRKVRQAKEIADYNNKLAIENWERQNEYNSPQQQMQRLSEAGLNPNLVYGSGAGSTGNAGTLDTAQMDSNPENYNGSDFVNGIANAVGTYYNIQTAQQKLNNERQVESLNRAKEESIRLKNEFDASVNGYKLETMALQTQQEAFKTYFKQVADYQKTVKQIDNLISELDHTKAKTAETYEQIKNLRKQRSYIDATISKMNIDIKEAQQRMRFSADLHPYYKQKMVIGNANDAAAYQNALTQGDYLQAKVLGEKIATGMAALKFSDYGRDKADERKLKELQIVKELTENMPGQASWLHNVRMHRQRVKGYKKVLSR